MTLITEISTGKTLSIEECAREHGMEQGYVQYLRAYELYGNQFIEFTNGSEECAPFNSSRFHLTIDNG